MATDPRLTATPTLEEDDVQRKMRIFNESFNSSLIGAAASQNNLISLSIGPQETDADIDLRSARALLNAHMMQVYDTVSNLGEWNDSINRSLNPDEPVSTATDSLPIYAAPFEVRGADLQTAIGGRTQAAVRTYGGSNMAAQAQYDVNEFTTADNANFVRMRMATSADGALNSYAVAYVDEMDPETGSVTGSYSKMFDKQIIITKKEDVYAFNNALTQSQMTRTNKGLPDDDILRDPNTGLPHVSQPLDKFYANLPEKHPHYNITPYEDYENKFLREMHADLLDKQMRHDYAELVNLHQERNMPIADAVVPDDTAIKKVNNRMRLLFSAQENPELSHDSVEEVGINVNRYTHRTSAQIASFLNTDPEIKRRSQFIAEVVASDGPERALREARSSDFNPNQVNHGTISVDVRALDPENERFKSLTYGQSLTNSALNVDFDLGKAKGFPTLIIAQDKSNYELAEILLGNDFEGLYNKGILTATTENLSMLGRNGKASEDLTVPTLRALFKQVMEDRNDTNMLNVGDAAQTIILSNRLSHSQISSQTETAKWLTKANVAFIAPQQPYASWSHFMEKEELHHARQYLQEELVKFENKRENLLDPDVQKNAPESQANMVLAGLITDHVADSLHEAENKKENAKRVLSLDEQISKFENDFEGTMSVLKNRTVKNTISSMMAFASDQIKNDPAIASPFNKLNVLLSEDFQVNKGSNRELSALAVGVIGKMMIDSHLSQHDPSYPEHSHFERYDQHKQDAVRVLADHIINDESFPHSKRREVGENTAKVISDVMNRYPAVNDDLNRKLLSTLSLAAQSVDIANQAPKYANVVIQTPGTEAAPAPVVASPSVKPLGPDQIEIDIQSELKYSTLAKSDKGIFAQNADIAAFFASTTPIEKEVMPVARTKIEEVMLMVMSNPEFRKLSEAVKSGKPYNMGGRPLFNTPRDPNASPDEKMERELPGLIPELAFFHQTAEQKAAEQAIIARGGKLDPKDKLHFDSNDIKSMSPAHKESAAAQLGLVYVMARESDLKNKPFQKGMSAAEYSKAVSAVELKASDYPTADHMVLDLVVQKLDEWNGAFSVDPKLLLAASKHVKPLVSKAFNESLRSQFTDLNDDIFSNDTYSILKMKGISNEASANVLNRVNDVSAGVDPDTLNEAVKTENYAYLADTVKQSPDFTKFMSSLVTDQIEQPNNKYVDVQLDIKDSISKVFPALAKIDSANFEPVDPNSMVSQLQLKSSIHQRHGSFKKHDLDMLKFESLEDAMVSYMAENLDYLDNLPNIKLRTGNIETGLVDDENAKLALKTLNDRNMGVAHPDMFKMNTAEFADKHFPNEINHEFDSYRTQPRNTIASAIDLEVHVREQGAGDNGFTAAYRLSHFKTPEDLMAQQKSDFRGNENLTVAKIRCNPNGQDIARAILYHSNDPLPAFPQLMPKELWTMDTEKYLTNDKLINTADLSRDEVKELSEKADISYHAVNIAPKPEVADSKPKASEPTVDAKAEEPRVNPTEIRDHDIGNDMGM